MTNTNDSPRPTPAPSRTVAGLMATYPRIPWVRSQTAARILTNLHEKARTAILTHQTDAPFRVLVTGARAYFGEYQQMRPVVDAILFGMLAAVDYDPTRILFVHGSTMGWDFMVSRTCVRNGWRQEIHPVTPADYRRDGHRAPLLRDERMVAAGADLCLAAPHYEKASRGTRYTLARAVDARIPALVLTAPGPPYFTLSYLTYEDGEQSS